MADPSSSDGRAFLVVWMSRDGSRSLDDEVRAVDAAAAALQAARLVTEGGLGAGAAWRVVAVVELDAVTVLGNHLAGWLE